MSVIRGTALTHFHQLVAELGGSGTALATSAHIADDDIGRHDRFISLPNGARMLEAAAATLDVPDFGRRLALRQGIEILGPVGLAGRSAATVTEAFSIFDTFMAAYSPSISARVTAHLDPDLRRFEFEYLLDPSPPQVQAVELSLGVTLQVLRLFLGPNYRPVAVHLPHHPVTPADDYESYFGCPPVFGESVAGFTLRASDLGRPLPSDRLAHQTALDYLSGTVGQSSPPTSQLVRTLVRQLLPTGVIGLTDIARHVSMHPKALQRRLAAENVTYSALVDETRREAAHRLLLDTALSLDQMCRQLGYAEHSVFTRACKRWFGMTPSAYRAGGGPSGR
ncbi:AraC family transcriptional regulator [Mycobacterium sp. AMU20-3851]|uniref:AraC family transcriptional regulator n=1 Tax=Mycobacterium sp. AMU20-3851 TaxID=3122055 RepID=UPI0037542889